MHLALTDEHQGFVNLQQNPGDCQAKTGGGKFSD